MKKSFINTKDYILFLVLLIVLVLINLYFFLPPNIMYYGDDSVFHFLRIDALIHSIQNRSFPFYIDYDSFGGYGYATKWFYSDFLLIPFGLLGTVTNLLFAYKFLLFVASLLCGIFMYICVNKIFQNEKVGIIAALLYTFCSYRLYDMFERAALGEALSFTLIPLIFLGIYEITQGNYKKWYILSISFSLLIYTHLISTLLMLSVLILYLLINYKCLVKEPKRIRYLFLSVFISVFLAAYYLFPMLEQMLSNIFYFNGGKRIGSVEDSTLQPLLMALGLLKGLPINSINYIGPAIGIFLALPLCFRLFVRKKSTNLRVADICVLIGILYLVACLSFFPWGMFPFSKLSLIQMAYRLLTISSFFFAIGGAYYLCSVFKKQKSFYVILSVITIYVILMFVNESKNFHEKTPIEEPSLSDSRFTIGNGEYLPIKMPSTVYPNEYGDQIEKINENTQLNNFVKNKGVTELDIDLKNEDTVVLPLLFYKGYKAWLNECEIPIKQSQKGLIQLDIKNSGHIKVCYIGTPIQKISFYLTLLSFIGLIIFIYLNRKKVDA